MHKIRGQLRFELPPCSLLFDCVKKVNQVVSATVQYADDLNDIIRNLIEDKLLADHDEANGSIQTVVFAGKGSAHLGVLLQQRSALQDLRLEPLCRTVVLQHLFDVVGRTLNISDGCWSVFQSHRASTPSIR